MEGNNEQGKYMRAFGLFLFVLVTSGYILLVRLAHGRRNNCSNSDKDVSEFPLCLNLTMESDMDADSDGLECVGNLSDPVCPNSPTVNDDDHDDEEESNEPKPESCTEQDFSRNRRNIIDAAKIF